MCVSGILCPRETIYRGTEFRLRTRKGADSRARELLPFFLAKWIRGAVTELTRSITHRLVRTSAHDGKPEVCDLSYASAQRREPSFATVASDRSSRPIADLRAWRSLGQRRDDASSIGVRSEMRFNPSCVMKCEHSLITDLAIQRDATRQ